mmetsp:Transcript_5169/g.17255  ORF Transcript_5169/g.17255 Transcript_5169/m.17255 type:complete len:280 (-) Transcript_5169:1383-2222(-)
MRASQACILVSEPPRGRAAANAEAGIGVGNITGGMACSGTWIPGGTRITKPTQCTSFTNLLAMRRGTQSRTVYTCAFPSGRGGGHHFCGSHPCGFWKQFGACGLSFALSFATSRDLTSCSICVSKPHAARAAALEAWSKSQAPRAKVCSKSCVWSLIILCNVPVCAGVNCASVGGRWAAGNTPTATTVAVPATASDEIVAAAAASARSRAFLVTTVDQTGLSWYSGRSSLDLYLFFVSAARRVFRVCGDGKSVAAPRTGTVWYRRWRRSTLAAFGSTLA